MFKLFQVNSDVHWVAGDVIVVAATGYMGADSEVLTIAVITGRDITFTPALQFSHSGKVSSYH